MLTKTAELTAVKLGRMCFDEHECLTWSVQQIAKQKYPQEVALMYLQAYGLAQPTLKSRERLDNFYHWLLGQK